MFLGGDNASLIWDVVTLTKEAEPNSVIAVHASNYLLM